MIYKKLLAQSLAKKTCSVTANVIVTTIILAQSGLEQKPF